MIKGRAILAVAAMLFASPALATDFNVWIAARTAATAPYGATDYFPLVQGGATKKVAGNLIATLSGAQTLTNKTIDCANNTCTVRIGNDVSGLGTGIATFLGTPSGANLASALTTALPATKGGTGLTGLGTGVATALAAATNGATGPLAGLTPTNNNCVVGNGSAWTSTSCPGSSVSATAATPNIVVTPSPGTGTFTIGSTQPTNDISGSGTAIVTGNSTKLVLLGAFTYTLAQAGTTGFESQWSTCLLNTGSGTATVNATTSTFKGAGGTTALSLEPSQWACPTSDGTNYPTVSNAYPAAGGSAKYALQGGVLSVTVDTTTRYVGLPVNSAPATEAFTWPVVAPVGGTAKKLSVWLSGDPTVTATITFKKDPTGTPTDVGPVCTITSPATSCQSVITGTVADQDPVYVSVVGSGSGSTIQLSWSVEIDP